MHITSEISTDAISSSPGPVLDSSCVIEAVIIERGGNAAMPHRTVDPIVATSLKKFCLRQIISRETDPLDIQDFFI